MWAAADSLEDAGRSEGRAARLLDTLTPPSARRLSTSRLLRPSHHLINQGRNGCWEIKSFFLISAFSIF